MPSQGGDGLLRLRDERPLRSLFRLLARRPAKPAYGHSKDHRDDLRQITFALAVDRHGLPLLGSVKDGNASDKVSNLETIEFVHLRQKDLILRSEDPAKSPFGGPVSQSDLPPVV